MRDLHRRPADDQELLLAFAEYTVKSAAVVYAAGLTRLYGAILTETVKAFGEGLLLELKGGPGSGPALGNQNARKWRADEADIQRWRDKVKDLEAEKARKGAGWTDKDEENLQAARRILEQMEGKPEKPARPGPAPGPKDGKLSPKEWEKRVTKAVAIIRDMMNTIPDAIGTFLGIETGSSRKPTREELIEWREYVERVIRAWTRGESVNNVVKPKWLKAGEGSRLLNNYFKQLRGLQEGMSDSEEKEINEVAKQTAAQQREGEEVPRPTPQRPHNAGPYPLGRPGR